MGSVVVQETDFQWLRDAFPGLSYDPNTQVISGDLDFCARYDVASECLKIEGAEPGSTVQESDARICDVFAVRIELDRVADSAIDWPAVYDSDGRCKSIAEALEVPVQDLHVNSDRSCCLGIQIDAGPTSLERFIDDLVVPFFYRVSYAERFGIARVRQDLWDEYRHGADGLRDRLSDLSSARTGRNNPCSCGSGRKYKACCLSANEERVRSLRDRLRTMGDSQGERGPGESRATQRRRVSLR